MLDQVTARPANPKPDWDRLFDQYIASGLSQKAFCERESISYFGFRSRFQKSDKFTGKRRGKPTGKFVDVTPRRDVPAPVSGITLRYGDAVQIDCPSGLSVTVIAELAHALATHHGR